MFIFIKKTFYLQINDEYIKYVNDLLKKKYINYVDVEQTDLVRCGLVYQDSQVHKLESLPNGFVIKGDLFLDNLDKDIKLPEISKLNS